MTLDLISLCIEGIHRAEHKRSLGKKRHVLEQ